MSSAEPSPEGTAGPSPERTLEPGGLERGGMRRSGLFLLAFGSGFAVLTIEIAGARLIAPVFGLSAVPWTAVIGVILAALAMGSHLGGRLADAGSVPLSSVLVAAGVTGVLPVLGGDLPWLARDVLGFIPGALASAVILFAPPILCLGAVVPYLVKADTGSLGEVGRRAGDLSAVATAGSIAGTFATGFVLLPALPLSVLLSVTAVALLVMAALSQRILDGQLPASVLVLGALGLGSLGYAASRRPPDTLHRQQTLYSSVEVTERTWADGRVVREMWQNGGSSSAEYLDGSPAHKYVGVSGLLLEPVLGNVASMLVLGGAALTLPVAFQRANPGMQVDVVEIDPIVTELAGRYFAYGTESRPDIRVIHDDARVHLRASRVRYDLLYLDIFDHLLTVPWTMVTTEALTDMAARLEPGGLFAANVLSPLEGPGVAFMERYWSTLGEVFAETRVYVVDPDLDPAVTQNLIVIAALDSSALPQLAWPQAELRPDGRPLTDDWAPVEYLQARILVRGLGWN